MSKKEKPFAQWQNDKAVAKAYYSRAWWTSIVPALMIFSITCSSIGKNGGNPVVWLTQHWLVGSLCLFCLISLTIFAVAEISQGMRRSSRFTA